MPTFNLISTQEMERLISLGQRMTGLTKKRMNKMDFLELMGHLPKELLLQILLGEDWWKPTHLPRRLKVGGFKWDMLSIRKWGGREDDDAVIVAERRKQSDRNIKASIQIAMPFRSNIPYWGGVVKLGEKRMTLTQAPWTKHVGEKKCVGYKSGMKFIMGWKRQEADGFDWEKMELMGYSEKRATQIREERQARHNQRLALFMRRKRHAVNEACPCWTCVAATTCVCCSSSLCERGATARGYL